MGELWRRLWSYLQRGRLQRELDEEMRLHVERRAERLRERGVDAQQASYVSRRQFGNATALRESSRDLWGWRWIDDALGDLRFAARLLTKRPAFAAVAVCTLALGIGANTAVFSLVDGALLRPLPYRQPARLIVVFDKAVRERNLAQIFASFRDYEEYRRHARSLEQVAAATWAAGGAVMTGRGPARNVLAIPVTETFFQLFGVAPEIGRAFNAADLEHGCAVVLSDAFWRGALGGDGNALGRGLTLDQRPCAIIGVMPRAFEFYPRQAAMWRLITPDFKPPIHTVPVGIFGRLRSGATLAQAQSELTALHVALHHNDGWYERDILPVAFHMQEEFTFLAGRNLRTTMWALVAAVALVLLIACLNLANLLLGRSLARGREMAVRAAMGGGRGRLVRQLLVEALLLAALGGAAGVLIAFAAIRYFAAVNPVELPIGADVAIRWPVLGFTLLLSIATALAFGLAPAWKASRVDLGDNLRHAGRAAVGSRQRGARVLMAAQVALSVILLTAAGLLMQSVLRMGSAALGYRPAHVLATSLRLPSDRYPDPASRARFCDELQHRLDAMPGVERAAMASRLPPSGGTEVAVEVQGLPKSPGDLVHDVDDVEVGPGYFRVLGTPLRRGRAFGAHDRLGSEPAAVVNQAFVRRFFPHVEPLGQSIRIVQDDRKKPAPWLTVVGVVGDQKHSTVLQEMNWIEPAAVYEALDQNPQAQISIALRTAGEQSAIGPAIAREIAALDPALPAGDVEPMPQTISRLLAYPRFRAIVFGAFAVIALLLASVGLHGVLQQFVAQRTQEIGVRVAVGARRLDILHLVARQGLQPALAGLVVGLASAAALGRFLASLLYDVEPTDPLTLAAVASALLIVAVAAIVIPARRAASVDPVIALRCE